MNHRGVIPVIRSFSLLQKRNQSVVAKALTLKQYVDIGIPTEAHFHLEHHEFNLQNAVSKLEDGGLVVEVKALSADPFQRATIRSDGKHRSSIKIGSPVHGFTVGKILASKHPNWKEGDLFGAGLPFITHQSLSPKVLKRTAIWKLTDHVSEENITYGLGVLGMPGSTAYGGLIDVLRPNKGETIFVSSASGTVGGLVGMLAKQLYECNVIGSCGGPKKVELVKKTYGFDNAIDYKKASSAAELSAMLKEFAPKGIDMYFENVGGIHFESAFKALRPGGRIAICGFISDYNTEHPSPVQFNPMDMIYTAQRIEGFVCTPWLVGQKGNFLNDMSKWLKEGKVKAQEEVFHGIENWPHGFQALFTGNHMGKIVVKL
jgi:NADPH-dependent curcumin reductase CurA